MGANQSAPRMQDILSHDNSHYKVERIYRIHRFPQIYPSSSVRSRWAKAPRRTAVNVPVKM